MKVTLLLCAGMLTLLPALPVSATPTIEAAHLVAQAAINPIYMQYEGVHGTTSALQEAIEIASEAAEKARKKPGRTTFANIVLERGISEAAEANLSTDSKGNRVIDCEGFAKMLAKTLASNKAEMSHYARIGWELSEARAASKITSLAKSPSFEGTHNAVIAILDGIIQEMAAEDYAGAEDALEAIQKGKEKWIEIQGWD